VDDLATYFTLTSHDISFVLKQRRDHNRLGFAILLCTLRYLGFCPSSFSEIPLIVANYIGRQLKISPHQLAEYGSRTQTKSEHLQTIQQYLGFRKIDKARLHEFSEWLIHRALEHDSPSLLLTWLCQKFLSEKLLRPGITVLEGMIVNARNKVQEITFDKLCANISEERRALLDQLLVKDVNIRQTPLSWLRYGETAHSPEAILNVIKKLNYIRSFEVETWDFKLLNPNRIKLLTQLGRRSTNQALQRTYPQRRYPILMAFLKQTLADATDELIELFDRCLWNCYSRSRRELEKLKLEKSKIINEKIIMLEFIGDVILDKR